MKKTFQISSIFVASLLASTCALAEQAPKWNFVQATYAAVEIDDASELDLSGFGISGSKLINENLFIAASYQNISDDMVILNNNLKLDFTTLMAGIGYRYSLSNSTDAYGILSLVNAEVSASYFGEKDSEDDTGYSLTAGVRSMVTDAFELSGSVAYVDVFDDDDVSFAVNAFYHFNANLSAGASYSITDDANTLGASVRYSF